MNEKKPKPPPAPVERIQEMLEAGVRVAVIARHLGYTPQCIYLHKKRMQNDHRYFWVRLTQEHYELFREEAKAAKVSMSKLINSAINDAAAETLEKRKERSKS